MLPFLQSAPSKPAKSVVQPKTAPGGRSSFDPKFCALLGTILAEFKQLLTDSHSPLVTKKKHSDIKAVRDKMEAVVAWCEGVQQGTIHMALVQASMEGFQNQVTGPGAHQAAEFVDENLTILLDAFYAIVETNKLQRIYMPIFNMLQRLLMSVPARGPTHKSQAESNEFRMSQECRERILTLFAIITQQEQTSAQLDEMQHLKILQILMIFLDPNQSDKITKRFVNHVLKICFQLFDLKASKSASSSSSSSSMHGGAASFGNIAIRSTLQACLRQLLSLVLDSFNQEVEKIIGNQLFKEAMRKETGQYCRVSQAFLENLELIQGCSIFAVVEDTVQNLATALFIHEQASHDHGFGSSSLKKSSSSHSSGALIGGIMGSISNQHIWNFKPSLQTSCAVLDILSLFMDETGSLFVYFPRICKVFENQIIPTLIQMLKNLSGEASHGIRVVKSLVSVLVNLSCTSHYVHEEHQLSSHSSQRSEGNSASGRQSMADHNESPSQKSPARPTGSGTVFRTCEFQHLDQIVLIFSQIACVDNVLTQTAKDKEVTSNNVHQIIAKISWKHLVGLEALALCFQDKAIVAKLASLENGKAIIASLDAMTKVMNFIKLLDHKNGFSMMSHSFSSHGSDEIINLGSFQASGSSSSTNLAQPAPKSKKAQSRHGGSNEALLEQLRATKVLDETQQFQAEDDVAGLRYMLGPANIQHLLQEGIVGLIESLIEINDPGRRSARKAETLDQVKHEETRKKWDGKHDGEDRAIAKIWSSSVMIEGGMVSNFVEGAIAAQAGDGNNQLLGQAANLMNGLLEKLFYSIQKNQALFLEDKMKEEQIAHLLSSAHAGPSLVPHQQPGSPNLHPAGKQVASQTVTVPYALHTSMILQAIGSMIELLQEVGLSEHRDHFVRTLCSLCTSRQVTFMKADPSRNSSSLSGQPSEGSSLAGANKQSSHGFVLRIEQPMVTVGNVLACQTLIGYIQKKFTSPGGLPESVLSTLKKTQLLRSSGQASGASATSQAAALLRKSRKAQSFIETRRGKFALDPRTGEPSAGKGMAHEQDLEMWQCIIDTIVRLDSSISTQMEETGMFTTSGKRVGGPLPSARQSPALTAGGGQYSGSSSDTMSLIDFGKLQAKIQKAKSEKESGRGRRYSDGGGSSHSEDPQRVKSYASSYQTTGANQYGAGLSHRQSSRQLDLTKVGAQETSSADGLFALQSTQGIFSVDESGQSHLSFNVTMRKVWVIDGFRSPSKIEMGTLKLTQVDALNAKSPAHCGYLPQKQDLAALQRSLDDLIEQTEKANRLTLFKFGCAFQNCVGEHLGHKQAASMTQSQAEGSELTSNSVPVRLLERFMELLLFNLRRIELLWDQFVGIMGILQQSHTPKYQAFKKLSIEAVQSLIQSFFQFKKTQKQERKSLRTTLAQTQPGPEPPHAAALHSSSRPQPAIQIQDLSPDFSSCEQPRAVERQEAPVTVEDASDEEDAEALMDGQRQDEEDEDEELFGQMADDVGEEDEPAEAEEWAGTKWQATILQPLTNVMVSPNVADKLMALKSIEKVIQLCGQNMKHDGWKMIILNIGSASEIGASGTEFPDYADDADGCSASTRKVTAPASSVEAQKLEQQVVQHGFKCLKLIINNYIYLLGQENFISIFKCIQIFAQQDNENINSNLIAVGMFMNVADYNAKVTRSSQRLSVHSASRRVSELSQQKKQSQINVDFIWKQLFQRMQSISRDCKAEVRRSLIQTLENIIINYGNIICMDVWGMLLHKILLSMVKHSSDMFNKSCQRSQAAEVQLGELDTAGSSHQAAPERSSLLEPSQGGKLELLVTDAESETTGRQPTLASAASSSGQVSRHSLAPGDSSTQSFQASTKRKQMAFDDESVLKALKDNDEQSWSETSIQLISSTYRAIKIYIHLLDQERQQIDAAADAGQEGAGGEDVPTEADEMQPHKAEQEDGTAFHGVRLHALKKIWKEYHAILGSLINNSTQSESQINKTTLMVLQQIFTYQEDFLQNQSVIGATVDPNLPSQAPKSHQFFVEQFDCQILLLQKIKDWVDRENAYFEGVMRTALASVPRFVNRNKSLILKVTPDIVQYLSKIFSSMMMDGLGDDSQMPPNQKINSPDTIGVLLALAQSLQAGCKIIGEGLNQPGRPYKPLNEELLLYKFILQLNDVCASHEESQRLYLDFLLDTIEFRGCSHSESQIKKHLQILNAIICQGKVLTALMPWLIDKLYGRLRDLLDLRYDWAACRSLIYLHEHSSIDPGMDEDQQNLIQFAALHLLSLSSYLLDPARFKQRACSQVSEHSDSASTLQAAAKLRSHDLSVSAPELIDDEVYRDASELKKQIWSLTLPILKESLVFDIGKFDQQKAGQCLVESDEDQFIELVKVSQQLDLRAINFVVNDLLAFCASLKHRPGQAEAIGLSPSEIESELVSFVDESCQGALLSGTFSKHSPQLGTLRFLKKYNVMQSKAYSQAGASLTHNHLQNLFDLCKLGGMEEESEDDMVEEGVEKTDEGGEERQSDSLPAMKRSISSLARPILLNKCKEILRQFSQDELRYGSMKLPHARNNEVIFILKELASLSTSQPDHGPKQEAGPASQGSFLVELMPVLSELIVSQSDEIRVHLKALFLLISKRLGTK